MSLGATARVLTWNFLHAATKMPQIWVRFSAALFVGKGPDRRFAKNAGGNLHSSASGEVAAAKRCPASLNAYDFIHNMGVA